MNAITLKNNTVTYRSGSSIRERLAAYVKENINTIALGMYTLTGRIPDIETLRSMKALY